MPAAGRLDDGHVAGGPQQHARHQTYDDAERHPAARHGLLRQRLRPGGDEQRHEGTEPDQVAEREVDDARQAIDQRVADRDKPIDAARAQPREQDLDGKAHPPTIMRCILPNR